MLYIHTQSYIPKSHDSRPNDIASLRSRHEENPSPLERDSMSSFIPPPTKLFPNVSKTTFNGGLARRKDLYIKQRQDKKAREICRFTCFDSRREYWPEERRKAGKPDWLEVSGST